jgi:hypothetical protein
MNVDFSPLFENLHIEVKGECEIPECNEPAEHLWGYGSIMQVCAYHNTFDPRTATLEQLVGPTRR